MVYQRRQTRAKPRKAQSMMFPAPIGGWISNRSLALPSDGPPGAIVLDNYFPRASTVKLRRGKAIYATLVNTAIPVRALFAYRNGNNERLFASNDEAIYDITTVTNPYAAELVTELDQLIETETGDWFGWGSTDGLEVLEGTTNGEWYTVQFATTGGVYLIGVNGADTGFVFDGTDFVPYLPGGITRLSYDALAGDFAPGLVVTGGTSTATATIVSVHPQGLTDGYLYVTDVTGTFVDDEVITDTDTGSATVNGAPIIINTGITFEGTDLTTSDMSFVWVYKSRLFFVQKDSLNAWYLPPDQIGGEAKIFPLAGIFDLGGSLLFGQNWSLSSGASGGLSEQCVFVSTEGQVAVYQGDNPDEAESWSKVGVYRVGRPLGRRGFFRGGGDLAIATSVGLVPLSKAIELDVTSLSVATISYNIADAWADALRLRGPADWVAELWPDQRMALVAPPDMIGASNPTLFVVNSETGAWCRFTNWTVLCMVVFRGQLYFGSPNGAIYLANVSGQDEGAVYTGAIIPMFQDCGSPMSMKVGGMVRGVSRANVQANALACINYDFDESPPPPPNASPEVGGSLWGTGIWGQSVWGGQFPTIVNQDWQAGGGYGYTLAPTYQVSSGSIGPIDEELIRLELTYTLAEVVT